MKTNILKAICNLIEFNRSDIMQIFNGSNRINNVGTGLEYFIKDIFCGSLEYGTLLEKDKAYSKYLSCIGDQNHPPDFMISDGDAVEVKKIESLNSDIALNSSYPKSKLFADSEMITGNCRNCEKWVSKDIIYSIGAINPRKKTCLKILWMVYGDCYASDKETYESVKSKISKGVNQMNGVVFSKTKEFGRVNNVDPLGITYLRIRGMWGIENPRSVFEYIVKVNEKDDFTLVALMKNEKYNSFPKEDIRNIEKIKNNNLSIADVEIKNPSNPAIFVPAKLIKYVIN